MRHALTSRQPPRDFAARKSNLRPGIISLSRSQLLSLPAELRDIIYRVVVVEDDGVEVFDRGFARSLLLVTCKIMRSEVGLQGAQ